MRGKIRAPALPAHLQQRKPRSGVTHGTRAGRRQPHAQLLQMRALPRKPLGRRHEPAREPVELLGAPLHHAAETACERRMPMIELAQQQHALRADEFGGAGGRRCAHVGGESAIVKSVS